MSEFTPITTQEELDDIIKRRIDRVNKSWERREIEHLTVIRTLERIISTKIEGETRE